MKRGFLLVLASVVLLVSACAPVPSGVGDAAGEDLVSAALLASEGEPEADTGGDSPYFDADDATIDALLRAIEASETDSQTEKDTSRSAVLNGAPRLAEIFPAGAPATTNRSITVIPGTGYQLPALSLPVGARWIDNATNEIGYRIRARLVILALPFQLPPWIQYPIVLPFQTVADVAANESSAQFNVDVPNISISFPVIIQVQVRARFANADDQSSNTASLRSLLSFPFGASFLPPSSLAAAAVNTTAVRLTWIDNYRNEPESIRYFVERRIGSDFVVVTHVPANHNEFIVTGLTPGSFHTFRVRSAPIGPDADSGRFTPSAYTSNFSVNTPAFALAAPSNLTATAVSSAQINLQWTDTTTNETAFFVEIAPEISGPFTVIADGLPPNTTTFSVTGLTAGTTHVFRVRSRNAEGFSAYTPRISATTQAAPTAPAAPSNVEALPLDANVIELRWRDNSNNETHFVIERSQNGGAFVSLGAFETGVLNRDPFDPNIIDVTDEGADVLASTTFCYRIRARNTVGDSANSAAACATTPAVGATAVRFFNDTAYPLVSLVVNGVERLPGSLVIPPGGDGLVTVPAGSFNFVAINGFIQSGQKTGLYRFPLSGQTSGNVSAGQTADRTLSDYPLGEILTRFTGAPRTYSALLIVGDLTAVYTCTFFPNGDYEYLQDGQLLDAGTVSLDSYPGNLQIPFHLDSPPPVNGFTAALFDETPDAQGRCAILMAGMIFTD